MNPVPLRSTGPASPRSLGGPMIFNIRQSSAPSSMSKGTSPTADTRKAALYLDPPWLFLKERLVLREVFIE